MSLQNSSRIAEMERIYFKLFRQLPPHRVNETPEQRASRLTRAIFTGIRLIEESNLPTPRSWPPRPL